MARRQGPRFPSLIYDKAFEAHGVTRREAADSHQGQGHDRSRNRPDRFVHSTPPTAKRSEEIECRHMAIAKGFRRFGRIRLDETAVRVRKIHTKIVEANLLAADVPIRLAEIRLRMTRTMAPRHEHLPRP